MNLEQEFAIDVAANTGNHLFITGPAGSGKSYTLGLITAELRKKRKRFIIGAPSGIAAINVGGRTLHSIFQLPFQYFSPNDSSLRVPKIYNVFKYDQMKLGVLKNLDVLIIDEISMVAAPLLDTIDTILRTFRKIDKPFGGVQLICLGDLQQLPPVVKEWNLLKSFYKTPYFFSSKIIKKLIKKDKFFQISLTKIYRQSDLEFIELLNRCRLGKPTKKDVKKLNKKYDPSFLIGPEFTTLTTHNAQAEKINESIYRMNSNPEFTYVGKITNKFPMRRGKPDAQVPMELKLKVGLPVIFCANSQPAGEYTNSQIGVVSRLEENLILVDVGGRQVKVDLHTWEAKDFKLEENRDANGIRTRGTSIVSVVKGSFEQYPIKQSSAISVHKSQGLTLSHVATDLSKSFAAGQSYVSLSRCESYENLVLLSKIKKANIFADPIIEKFQTYSVTKKYMKKYFKKKLGPSWKSILKGTAEVPDAFQPITDDSNMPDFVTPFGPNDKTPPPSTKVTYEKISIPSRIGNCCKTCERNFIIKPDVPEGLSDYCENCRPF